MNRYLQQLSEGLETCGLKTNRVLLAVSGGPDSVAMLRGTVTLQQKLRLTVRVAHLNHSLRGEQSAADARWLTELCRELCVPLVVGTADVRDSMQKSGHGLEETARQVRYEFLEKTAQQQEIAHIAVAHNSDDQAETILHHILRGTGMTGLRGMSRSRNLGSGAVLVRPQLDISRHEIEDYLREIEQAIRVDPSNLDQSHTRNRIRHSLLPVLQRDFNPQVGAALLRLGCQADQVEQMIDSLAEDLLQRIVIDRSPLMVRVDCDQLVHESSYLIRACLNRLWQQLGWPRQRMGFNEWQTLERLVGDDGVVTLPGKIEARRRGRLLVLRRL